MTRVVTTPASTPVSSAPALRALEPARQSASLISFATLVIWLFCLGVGATGLLLPYARPQPPAPEPPPVIAEVLNVQLSHDPLPPPPPRVAAPDPLQPPTIDHAVMLPAPPALVAVAEPSPAVAFALPVEGPSRIVDAAQASPVVREEPTVQVPAPPPPVQAITYGQGEGRQPAPEYPRRAVREGQEGVVTIRFSVGEDGRVITAQAVSPSPWPILNDAALRVVRDRWRFREGPPRLYEVAIRFELTK